VHKGRDDDYIRLGERKRWKGIRGGTTNHSTKTGEKRDAKNHKLNILWQTSIEQIESGADELKSKEFQKRPPPKLGASCSTVSLDFPLAPRRKGFIYEGRGGTGKKKERHLEKNKSIRERVPWSGRSRKDQRRPLLLNDQRAEKSEEKRLQEAATCRRPTRKTRIKEKKKKKKDVQHRW